MAVTALPLSGRRVEVRRRRQCDTTWIQLGHEADRYGNGCCLAASGPLCELRRLVVVFGYSP